MGIKILKEESDSAFCMLLGSSDTEPFGYGAHPCINFGILPTLSPFQKKRSCRYKITFILCQGGTAVDAVEAAVRSLEDNPTFDAGHGSALTEELTVEVDAMIMEGNTLDSGTNLIL